MSWEMAWLRALPERPLKGSVGGEFGAADVGMGLEGRARDAGEGVESPGPEELSEGVAFPGGCASHPRRPSLSPVIVGSTGNASGDLPLGG
jgi:hypothetical protein